ncbi:MAG: hypothetical protein IKC47_03390 [Clostridia bacterium]|nr:hypothetical protein [Clostridia bacterium]
MKKFTALMLVAVCLIVGGVYATWSYATGNINTYLTEWVHPSLVDVSGTPSLKGNIKVVSNTLAISVDDLLDGEGNAVPAGTQGDYVAEVYYTGELQVSFTPNLGADETVIENGIAMEMIVVLTKGNYAGTEIFSVASDPAAAQVTLYSPVLTTGVSNAAATEANQIGTVTKNADGSFTWTVTGEQFGAFFAFYGGAQLKLDTFSKHTAFDTALSASSFKLNIGEKGKVADLMNI